MTDQELFEKTLRAKYSGYSLSKAAQAYGDLEAGEYIDNDVAMFFEGWNLCREAEALDDPKRAQG